MISPFITDFPVEVQRLILAEQKYIVATDGFKLAYYDYVPEKPVATLLFYHGGGAWSSKLYQYMAQKLSKDHNIATYLFDIRGHGNSEGPPGDAPSCKQVWQDIRAAVDFIKKKHKDLPLFVGGHSAGGGLVLNYSAWHKHPDVAGYVFLAPFLGARSGTTYEHSDPRRRFVKKVRFVPLILSAITGGWLFAHSPVIYFNYPRKIRGLNGHLLEYYTSAMAMATSPQDPTKLFAGLMKPFVLFAAEKDEQFIPEKLLEVSNAAGLVRDSSIAKVLPGATHLSIVWESPAAIAAGVIGLLEAGNS